MKLEDQVCALELAMKLKELGVKQTSYFVINDDGAVFPREPRHETSTFVRAAFTVAELGEMLPLEINIPFKNGRRRSHDHWRSLGRYRVSGDNSFFAAYRGGNNITSIEQRANSEANARAKMLIYILEKHLLTP